MRRLAFLAWCCCLLSLGSCNRDTALGIGLMSDGSGGAVEPDLARPDNPAGDMSGDLSGGAPCRTVEFQFTPGMADLQIVVWVETPGGVHIDTPYITRLTGTFGLGNRPGNARLKTDFRWPFGRREMVFPVWAHRRNHHYPKLVMGGVCGNSMQSLCPGGNACGVDCDDDSIAYHGRVSSAEPFYCSPSGASGLDAMTCASRGNFPKGAFADPPAFSLYPPRGDLKKFEPTDSQEMQQLAALNDLVAVSQATPPAGKELNPTVLWNPPAGEGDYVAWIELSRESDFNGSHNHPNVPDNQVLWDLEGHPFLGQPSVLYRLPFHVGRQPGDTATRDYAGYSTWDGSDGVLHPPDGSITTNKAGSGAGRLLDTPNGGGPWRFKARLSNCP